MEGTCECGCGAKTSIAKNTDSRWGLIKGRPRRFITGHSRRPKDWNASAVDFVANRATPVGDCWIWTAAASSEGYGRIGKKYAHRVSYEAYRVEIPDGLQLDHLCRNRLCVNPWHLEPVTQRVNILRGDSPSARHAEGGACVHGHEFTPENTYRRKDTGARMCRECKRQRDRKRRTRVYVEQVA